MEEAGATVRLEENGQLAIDAALAAKDSGEPFDCILMDMQMPVMDGLTATREIRKALSTTDLPILAMTANARVKDREECLAAGMNDHVTKPIDPDQLFTALLQWVKPGERGSWT